MKIYVVQLTVFVFLLKVDIIWETMAYMNFKHKKYANKEVSYAPCHRYPISFGNAKGYQALFFKCPIDENRQM